MENIKFLVCGDTKAPQRKYGDAGVDIYVPNYSEQYIKDLQKFNPDMTIEGNGGINIHYNKVEGKHIIQVFPHQDIRIPTYIKALIPSNMCLRMSNKSGVATKQKLVVGAEIIDSSYEGFCDLHMFNASNKLATIDFGQKISQLLPIVINSEDIEVFNEKDISSEEFYKNHDHSRGIGGFGSTGLS